MPMTLTDLFAPAEDEGAVLSVCAARRVRADPWMLAYGSLLLVPQACADTNWPDWQRSEGRELAARPYKQLRASACVEGETWMLGRVPLALADAERWFEALQSTSTSRGAAQVTLPVAAPLPELHAHLEHPEALLQVFPGIDSPSSSLLAGLGRPSSALLWRSVDETPVELPQMVDVDGETLFLPSRDIAGLHITDSSVDRSVATARGILVGRAERTAWLGESRGSGDFEHYQASIRWDPRRIDLADLEITHVERLGRDTVLSSRIQMDDLDLEAARNAGTCLVQLPTIGRTVTHELLLHTVEGELLDRNGPYPLEERIVMNMTVNGHTMEPRVHGITDAPPGLEERLQRRDQFQAELETLLRNSAQARMLADRQSALQQLKTMLASARGELLIQDRYFGQDLDDWRLLDDIEIPVRVLTGKLARDEHGNTAPAQIESHVTARYRPKAPIHERVYLWDRGGATVGGSPTTFGNAPVRIARLRAAEVVQWRAEFEALWSSPDFAAVPQI